MARYTDFESGKACIQAHGHQLQRFALDIHDLNAAMAYWYSGYEHWNHRNFFLERVLNLHPSDDGLPWSLPLERLLQGNQITCFGSSVAVVHSLPG